MAASGYIDIHTHHTGTITGKSIRSFYANFDIVQTGLLCSVGLHPWYINQQTLNDELAQIQDLAMLPGVVAIGECGLDKVCETDWQLQEEAFIQQIQLANKVNKPLIIHCVKAYDEVTAILRMHKMAVPVIFHGFDKNIQLAWQLLASGYYISFGGALLKKHANARKIIADIPANKFFLETDDAPVSIGEIYDIAALLRKTEMDTLILQLQNNFETVFKQ